NTEATSITASLPEITPFIALQLRVAKLEQEMSEVKKTDHQADVLASIKSQVPMASIKNQESEKSPKEIIRIKKEQGEEKQDSTYSIRSTDKVAFEEFDVKSALFRNPANYHLYHALMEALIADEDAMDKEVTVKVKDHKRKHDSDDEEDDDDDDEGPSAGSNQGRSAKRRRPESAASGSAQPPSKDDHQSSKKPRESDASASKQHPALTSTGWQITDKCLIDWICKDKNPHATYRQEPSVAISPQTSVSKDKRRRGQELVESSYATLIIPNGAFIQPKVMIMMDQRSAIRTSSLEIQPYQFRQDDSLPQES
ncbi:hypothetical protein Tco_0696118, partial [Tanacetum coccineum]